MPADAARYAAARRAFGAPRFFAAYRAWRAHGDAVFHDLLSPRLHEAWTRGMAEERSMCSRISISISPWPWRRREGRTPGAWGSQRWGQRSRGGLAPLASRRIRCTTTCVLSAARSGASRHLVVGVDVRSTTPPTHDGRGRRVVPPERCAGKTAERAGATPPPAPLRGPGCDPGGRSCPRWPDHRPPRDLRRDTRFPLPFRCAWRAGTSRPSD